MPYKQRPDGTWYWEPTQSPHNNPNQNLSSGNAAGNQSNSQQAPTGARGLPQLGGATSMSDYAFNQEAQDRVGQRNANLMNERISNKKDPMTGMDPVAPWEPTAPYTRPDGSIMPSTAQRGSGPMQPVLRYDPATGRYVNTRAGQRREMAPYAHPSTGDEYTFPPGYGPGIIPGAQYNAETNTYDPTDDGGEGGGGSPTDPGNPLGTSQRFGGFNFERDQDRVGSVKDSFAYWASQAPPAPTDKAALEEWINTHVIPGMKADGHEILGVEGDKITYRWAADGKVYVVDYAANAGSPEMTLAWGVESVDGKPTGGGVPGVTGAGGDGSNPFANFGFNGPLTADDLLGLNPMSPGGTRGARFTLDDILAWFMQMQGVPFDDPRNRG